MAKRKKHEGPRYRKLYPMFWRDADVRAMDDAHKVVAAYCMTSHQTNRIGLFVLSPALASEELGTTVQTFLKRLANVCETLGWGWDERARVLYLPSWWRWNHPENQNVMKGNLDDLAEIPQTSLVKRFATNLDFLAANVTETFTQTLAKRYPQRSGNQEQEQEQDQEQEQEQEVSAPPAVTKPKRFVVPTVEEVAAYCLERKNGISPQKFIDTYTARDWKYGKTQMSDWKAAVRTWEQNDYGNKPASTPGPGQLFDGIRPLGRV